MQYPFQLPGERKNILSEIRFQFVWGDVEFLKLITKSARQEMELQERREEGEKVHKSSTRIRRRNDTHYDNGKGILLNYTNYMN